MYLPKSQYTLKTINELGVFNLLEVPEGVADSSKLESIKNTLFNQETQVIVTSFGAIYSTEGVDLDKGNFANAIKLQVVNPNTNNPALSSASKTPASSTKLPPTSEDLKRGVMKRCFSKNNCTGKVQEISKIQYNSLVKNTDRCIRVYCMDWLVTGPAKDQTVNGYYLAGVESRNEKQLQKLKEALPGAEALIQSPTEYLQEIVIPGAQQASSSPLGLNIPAPSKSL